MRNKKNTGTYLIFSTLRLFVPTFFLSRHTGCTSYLTCHTIPHIYAPILLIFQPLLKTKTGSTRCKQTLEVQWRRRKTVHIIGIQQVQTGPDSFRHVKLSRSATATERTWDVTETFFSVWTPPLKLHMRKFYWTVTFRDGTETWLIVWISHNWHRCLA